MKESSKNYYQVVTFDDLNSCKAQEYGNDDKFVKDDRSEEIVEFLCQFDDFKVVRDKVLKI